MCVCPQAELKHARLCMLGVLGYVSVDLGFRVPYAPEVRQWVDSSRPGSPAGGLRLCWGCCWLVLPDTEHLGAIVAVS